MFCFTNQLNTNKQTHTHKTKQTINTQKQNKQTTTKQQKHKQKKQTTNKKNNDDFWRLPDQQGYRHPGVPHAEAGRRAGYNERAAICCLTKQSINQTNNQAIKQINKQTINQQINNNIQNNNNYNYNNKDTYL